MKAWRISLLLAMLSTAVAVGFVAREVPVTAAVTPAALPALDPTFGSGGLVGLGNWTHVVSVVERPGRKLLVAVERLDRYGVLQEHGVVRLTASGSIDGTFAAGGPTPGTLLWPLNTGSRMLVRASGAILVSGANQLQYTEAGEVDTSFGTDGLVPISSSGPVFELDDRTLILSSYLPSGFGGLLLQHLSATGEVLPGGLNFTYVPALEMVPVRLPGGGWRLLTSGDADRNSPYGENQILALSSAGEIDVSFGGGDGIVATGLHTTVAAGGIAAGTRLLVATFVSAAGSNVYTITRYTATGALDTGWGTAGQATGSGLVDSMDVNDDGSLTLGVSERYDWPGPNPYLASVQCMLASGLVDTAFNNHGVRAGSVWLVELGVTGYSVGAHVTTLANSQIIVARDRFEPAVSEPSHAELVRITIPVHNALHLSSSAATATAPAERLGHPDGIP